MEKGCYLLASYGLRAKWMGKWPAPLLWQIHVVILCLWNLKKKAWSVCFPSSIFREVKWCFLVVLMFICSDESSGLLWVLKFSHLQRQLCKVEFYRELLHCSKIVLIMVPAQESL